MKDFLLLFGGLGWWKDGQEGKQEVSLPWLLADQKKLPVNQDSAVASASLVFS